jgi:hypothetical protein
VIVKKPINLTLGSESLHIRALQPITADHHNIIATMYSSIKSLLLLCLVGAASASYFDNMCCICGDCSQHVVSGREDVPVTEDGKTCNELFLWMVDPSNGVGAAGSAKCNTIQANEGQECCDPDTEIIPVVVNESEDDDGGNNMPQGSEDWCDLCADGGKPSNRNVVTAVLYMEGNPTCIQLYHMGRKGRILNRLCNPLQDFFDVPCGC